MLNPAAAAAAAARHPVSVVTVSSYLTALLRSLFVNKQALFQGARWSWRWRWTVQAQHCRFHRTYKGRIQFSSSPIP